jgi:predicted Rossmann fold nucleotide-binding protein DprA/Smf involved in DNA uptake
VTVTALSADSQAITLLCSALASPRGADVKPLSPTEWSSLATTIHRSDLQRPGALLGRDSDALQRELGVSTEAARRLTALLSRGGQLALELDRLAGRGIWIVTRADESYPPLLKERLKSTAPPVLFGAGRQTLLLERAIAVVGSREADQSSLAFASHLARRCAEGGFAVVSGAARGIDSAAMVAAADAGGNAIGFVADALEKMTRRQDLREHLVDGEMALVSAYHPAARFTVGNAMRRNRLIYCLAEAAVVVASGGENGGTRGGALEDLKAGWTPLFVRADEDAPAGNRDLIATGGRPLRREELEDAEAIHLLLARAAAESDHQVSLDDVRAAEALRGATGHPAGGIVTAATANAAGDHRREAGLVEGEGPEEGEPAAAAAGDLFPLVWSRLAQFLEEPRSEKDVAEAFALELTQARAWLKRAVVEGLVDRLGRQRRYRVAAERPPSLFGLDEATKRRRQP